MRIDSIVSTLKDKKGLNKGDAHVYIYDHFNAAMVEGKVDPEDYVPQNVQDVIVDVDCDYMQFTNETFYCLEKFEKTKKKSILAIEPLEVNALCASCKQSKLDAYNRMLAKEQRKESVKKLAEFAKQFMRVTEEGFLSTTYMCTCNIIEGDIKFSRDAKTLICPILDNELVSIEDTCFTALNPKSEQPPCQYLIPLEHQVAITPEDLKKMNLEIPSVEYQQPHVDMDKLNPKPEPHPYADEIPIEGNTKLIETTATEIIEDEEDEN